MNNEEKMRDFLVALGQFEQNPFKREQALKIIRDLLGNGDDALLAEVYRRFNCRNNHKENVP